MVVPAPTPVTSPFVPIIVIAVAAVGSLLLQVPPTGLLLNTIEEPSQIADGPAIVPGTAFTVRVMAR